MKIKSLIFVLLLCVIGAGTLLFKTSNVFQAQTSMEQKAIPAILDQKYQRPDDLTDAEKYEIDDLFERSGIVAVGRVVDTAPEGEKFIIPAIIIDEIFKLKTDVVNSPDKLIGRPIFVQRFLMQQPDYSSKRKYMGKYFLIYGYVDEIPKNHLYSKITKSNLRISTSRETIAVTQNDIERAIGDIIFLGIRSTNKNDWSVPKHGQFNTMTFFVEKELTNTSAKKIVVRFLLQMPINKGKFRLNLFEINYRSHRYWVAADKIDGTEHYDATVIGAELSKEIIYLRHKRDTE